MPIVRRQFLLLARSRFQRSRPTSFSYKKWNYSQPDPTIHREPELTYNTSCNFGKISKVLSVIKSKRLITIPNDCWITTFNSTSSNTKTDSPGDPLIFSDDVIISNVEKEAIHRHNFDFKKMGMLKQEFIVIKNSRWVKFHLLTWNVTICIGLILNRHYKETESYKTENRYSGNINKYNKLFNNFHHAFRTGKLALCNVC